MGDLEGLTALLGRVAALMDASGVIVWVGNAAGADLQASAAHGYTPQVLARIPTVPRSADNAAAAAYRLGRMQVVASRPGSSSGAVVAPLVSVDGTIGALSAEIRDGGETSASVQALATIFAAQLAGILTAVPSADRTRPRRLAPPFPTGSDGRPACSPCRRRTWSWNQLPASSSPVPEQGHAAGDFPYRLPAVDLASKRRCGASSLCDRRPPAAQRPSTSRSSGPPAPRGRDRCRSAKR